MISSRFESRNTVMTGYQRQSPRELDTQLCTSNRAFNTTYNGDKSTLPANETTTVPIGLSLTHIAGNYVGKGQRECISLHRCFNFLATQTYLRMLELCLR